MTERAAPNCRPPNSPRKRRPTFTVQLRPEPDVADPVRALRAALKYLLRRCRLRAVSVSEHNR